jgi:hypothetical protein
MTSKTRLLVLLLFCPGVISASAQQAPTPQQLLDAAHKATDIASAGAYVLHADVVINAGGQPEHHAKLTIYRDHDRARVTLESDGRIEERVILRGKQLVVPGHGTLEAIGLSAFDQIWNPIRRMKFANNTESTLGSVSAHKIHKRDAWCFDRKSPWEFSGKTNEIKSTLCFDAATAVLVRESSDETTNQEFLDYTSFGTAMYPRKVQILRENRAPIVVRHISVQPATLTDDTFKEPTNSMEVESCSDEVSPKAIRTPEPEFPKAGSNARMQLLVYLYVLLDKEGKVAGLQRRANDSLRPQPVPALKFTSLRPLASPFAPAMGCRAGLPSSPRFLLRCVRTRYPQANPLCPPSRSSLYCYQ